MTPDLLTAVAADYAMAAVFAEERAVDDWFAVAVSGAEVHATTGASQ